MLKFMLKFVENLIKKKRKNCKKKINFAVKITATFSRCFLEFLVCFTRFFSKDFSRVFFLKIVKGKKRHCGNGKEERMGEFAEFIGVVEKLVLQQFFLFDNILGKFSVIYSIVFCKLLLVFGRINS